MKLGFTSENLRSLFNVKLRAVKQLTRKMEAFYFAVFLGFRQLFSLSRSVLNPSLGVDPE